MTRRRDRGQRTEAGVWQAPFRQPAYAYRPMEVISADEVAAIHATALTILAEIGIKVLSAEARRLYASAGAENEAGTDRVRFPTGMAMELVAKAPAEFLLHARDPAKTVRIGGRHLIFSSVGEIGRAHV